MDIKYYDIGLNLFTRSFPKPEKIIADAAVDGICCILTGSEARENRLVNQFVRHHTAFGTAGIHPHVVDEATEADLEEIRRIITTNPKVVAVGETGLDYDRMYSKKENQLHFFKALIAMAEELGKPCSFMNGTQLMTSWLVSRGMKGFARNRSSTVIRATRRRWKRCSIWVFISVLPAGSAMNGGRLPYAMLYPSCLWTGSSSKRMHRT